MTAARLVLATHNADKLREYRALLEDLAFTVQSCGELGLPEPEETGDTFVANAELKARAACEAAHLPAFSDDSGLVIPALDGAPGLYSARWTEGKGYVHAMNRVAQALEAKGHAVEGTPAYFVCALSLALPDGRIRTVQGEAHGVLTWPARGGRGFGYDPMFMPQGHAESYGEMDQDAKNRISHRAVAFGMFRAQSLPLLLEWFARQAA